MKGKKDVVFVVASLMEKLKISLFMGLSSSSFKESANQGEYLSIHKPTKSWDKIKKKRKVKHLVELYREKKSKE